VSVSPVASLSEGELIGRIRERLAAVPPPDWLQVGIGDDAAVVETERNRLEVLTVDAIVEGVHFDRAFTPPSAIGHRAVAVNLSDLAAMGATPRLALLSLVLPRTFPLADFDEIIGSMSALAARFRMTIVGGNLTQTDGPLVLDVTVVGTVKKRRALTRGGARPGDDVYVTGVIGAAAAGLQMLQAEPNCAAVESVDPCVRQYLYPEPRVRFGTILSRNRGATACMDLSDGLADAVHQIAGASQVGATIDGAALPIAASARRWFEERGQNAVDASVTGGDDYELLFTARPRLRGRLAAAQQHGHAPMTRIGSCTADRAVLLRDGGVERPMPPGYSHFR